MHILASFPASLLVLLLLSPALQGKTADVDPSIVTHEQGVVDLTDDTFFDYIKEHKNVVVLFRDRVCEECPQIQEDIRVSIKKFAPPGANWHIGRLNVHKYHQFHKILMIQKFPKVRFYFDNEFHTTLNEVPNQIAIEHFLSHIALIQAKPRELSTPEDWEDLKHHNVAMVLSLPNFNQEGRYFAETLQKVFPSIPLYTTIADSRFDQDLFGVDKPSFKFMLKRNFDDGNREITSHHMFQAEVILNLVNRFRFERVRRLDQENFEMIQSHNHAFVIVFDHDYYTPNVKTFRELMIRQHYTGLIIRSNLREPEIGPEVGQLLGVETKDFPTVLIVRNHHRRLQKYRYNGPFTQEALKEFMDSYIKGGVSEYMRDQKKAKQHSRKPRELVRSTFAKHIQDSQKHVLVLFYKKRNHKSDEMRGALHHVVNQLTEENDIEVVQTDAGLNDYEWVNFRALPQVFLYPLDSKDKPVEFTGRPDDSDIINFLGDELKKYIHRKSPAEVRQEWDL